MLRDWLNLYRYIGRKLAIHKLYAVFIISLAFSPCNIEPPTLACGKGTLIRLKNLCPHPIYYIITEDICLIKPCKRLLFANKCAFISNISSVTEAVESTAEGMAAKIFTYIFFNKLFI